MIKAEKAIYQEIEAHKEERANGDVKYCVGDFDDSDLSVVATVEGPKGTPYEGGYFMFRFSFTEFYPHKSAEIVPQMVLPHPCITHKRIGLEVVEKEKHKDRISFLEVLDTIACLLEMPEMGIAVNKEVRELFLNDREKFNMEVRAAVKKQNEKR